MILALQKSCTYFQKPGYFNYHKTQDFHCQCQHYPNSALESSVPSGLCDLLTVVSSFNIMKLTKIFFFHLQFLCILHDLLSRRHQIDVSATKTYHKMLSFILYQKIKSSFPIFPILVTFYYPDEGSKASSCAA